LSAFAAAASLTGFAWWVPDVFARFEGLGSAAGGNLEEVEVLLRPLLCFKVMVTICLVAPAAIGE
jgi:hypothetical protein